MRYVKFTDRARDWLREHRTLFIQVAAIAGIAAIVGAIMVPGIAVTKGRHAAVMSHTSERIAGVEAELTGLAGDAVTTDAGLDTLAAELAQHATSIDALTTRLGIAQAKIIELEAGLPYSLKAWLTGTFGSYVLHAKSSQAGNFSASVWLCYDEPVALNATTFSGAMDEFYAGLDTTAAAFKPYVPSLSYNGTGWCVTAISFNIGTFTLEAEVVKTVAVGFGGLPEAYKPDWAYVEIWPAVKG